MEVARAIIRKGERGEKKERVKMVEWQVAYTKQNSLGERKKERKNKGEMWN